MPIRVFATILAIVLVGAYVVPLVVKLRDLPLGLVVLAGFAVMLVDLWQMLRESAD